MTLLAIVLLLSIGVFITAFVSPRKGTSAQLRSQRVLDIFISKIRRWPGWIQGLITKPPIVSHKTIDKSAELGKSAHKKSKGKG